MKKSAFFVLICFAVMAITTSCSVFDSPESIPAYLRIDSVQFVRTSGTQGTENQNITEAWVFIDDQLQGIYDLPCEIPILELGSREVKIRGGIKRNLNSNQRVDYPFFSTYKERVTFSSMQTIVLKPVVNYFDDAIVWEENFEDAGVRLIKGSGSDTAMFTETNPAEVFEGFGSGKIVFPENMARVLVQTNQRFKFPKGEPVFMEFNFKTSADLRVGLVAHTQSNGDVYDVIVGINNTNGQWKKGYINLSEYINYQSTVGEFDVYFSMSHQFYQSNDSAMVDNVKIVYPKRP